MSPKSSAGEPKPISNRLKKAAKAAAADVLALKKGEKVLIVTNPEPDVHTISLAVYQAAVERGAVPTLAVQPVKSQLDFAEPSVMGALREEPDVTISISHNKLGKDAQALKTPYKDGDKKFDHVFNYLLRMKRTRSFWSPSVTLDMFERTVPIDYQWLRKTAKGLKRVLDQADSVRVEAPGGTNLTIGVKGRTALSDDGDFRKGGTGGNLPSGEVFISPELGKSTGTIAFDGSIATVGDALVIEKPIICKVERGFVTDVVGDAGARTLLKSLDAGGRMARDFVKEKKITAAQGKVYERNARNLGELGIGLNKKARVVGNILEDEKVFGTCHIAIGSNYDDDAPALIHLDGIINKPTITAIYPSDRERVIMERGKLI